MRDTQEQIIQEHPEIVGVFAEVKTYRHTKSYFSDKLDEYEKKALELQKYNHDLRKQILFLRKDIKTHQDDFGFKLPLLEKNSIKLDYQSSDNRSAYSRSFALPTISQRNQTEMSVSSSKVSIKRKKIINIGEKIQKLKSCRLNPQDRTIKNQSIVIKEEPASQNKDESNDLRKKIMKIRERVTKFNKT